MITLNEACEKAYSRREEFEAVFELGIDVAYDRITYWTIGFDYVDPEAHDSPLALHPTGRCLCFCFDKETGEEVDGEDFSLDDILSNNIPGHEVTVPDNYYRVPWYESNI